MHRPLDNHFVCLLSIVLRININFNAWTHTMYIEHGIVIIFTSIEVIKSIISPKPHAENDKKLFMT